MRFDEGEMLAGEDGAADGRRTFRPDELAACDRCGRQSPPTRMSCLYCGAALGPPDGVEDLRRPALKPLGEGERGFNVVLLPRALEGEHQLEGSVRLEAGESAARLSDEAIDEAASLVRVGPEHLREMIAMRAPLPLARTGERAEVSLLERKLAELGLRFEIVSDDELALDAAPRRVRRLEFGAGEIAGWAGAGVEHWYERWDDLTLVVVGRIYRRRIEVEEQARRGAGREVVEARELTEDESVVDIHFTAARTLWRVAADGFDYSCLGARKGLLAAENFARLVETLRERAPRAAFDDAYARVRHLLRHAWPAAEHTESAGLRHAAPGRFRKGAVTVVTNEQQFTRYSRLAGLRAARRATGTT